MMQSIQLRIRTRNHFAAEVHHMIAEKKADCERYRTSGRQLKMHHPQEINPVENRIDCVTNPKMNDVYANIPHGLHSESPPNANTDALIESDLLIPRESSSGLSPDLECADDGLQSNTAEATRMVLMCHQECVRVEEEIRRLDVYRCDLDTESEALMKRCEELEKVLVGTIADNSSREDTIRSIKTELASKVKETELNRAKQGELESENSRNMDIRNELLQQLSESTTLHTDLELAVQDCNRQKGIFGKYIVELERELSRVIEQGRSIRASNHRENDSKAKFPPHQSDFFKVLERSTKLSGKTAKPRGGV